MNRIDFIGTLMVNFIWWTRKDTVTLHRSNEATNLKPR